MGVLNGTTPCLLLERDITRLGERTVEPLGPDEVVWIAGE